jgi:hypothetical protein
MKKYIRPTFECLDVKPIGILMVESGGGMFDGPGNEPDPNNTLAPQRVFF